MKKTTKRFLRFLWTDNAEGKYDKDWDHLLRNMINHKAEITDLDGRCGHTVTFEDKYVVWIENHPYASGSLYGIKGIWEPKALEDKKQCSMKTRILLEDYVNACLKKVKEKNLDPVTLEIREDIKKYSADIYLEYI